MGEGGEGQALEPGNPRSESQLCDSLTREELGALVDPVGSMLDPDSSAWGSGAHGEVFSWGLSTLLSWARGRPPASHVTFTRAFTPSELVFLSAKWMP